MSSEIDVVRESSGVKIALADLLIAADKQGSTVPYILRAERLLAKAEGEAFVRIIVATLGKALAAAPATKEGEPT